MRNLTTRWLALVGGSAWIVTVTGVALVSDVGAGSAVLAGLLGLLVVAVLVVGLTLHRQLLRIEARRGATAPRKKAAAAPERSRAAVDRVVAGVDKDLKRTFRQVEALHNLYAVLPIEHSLPASRGWPASPDLLLLLVDLIDRHRPTVVVECGSGLSTLCCALAMRRFGIDGRVIALEHLAEYAAQTDELLRRHGVADLAEVRTAPLEPFEAGEGTTPWYARAACEDIEGVGLLFVDGPPGKLGPLARYPALPVFVDRLAPGAQIVLDDFARPAERGLVDRWDREYPGRLSVETVPLEKGAALLTVR
jgi:predicted O-methyltransferase YrrM